MFAHLNFLFFCKCSGKTIYFLFEIPFTCSLSGVARQQSHLERDRVRLRQGHQDAAHTDLEAGHPDVQQVERRNMRTFNKKGLSEGLK